MKYRPRITRPVVMLSVFISGLSLLPAYGAEGTKTNTQAESSSKSQITTPSEPVDLGVPLPSSWEDGNFSVGVKCDYPPYAYINASQEKVGYGPAIARRLSYYAFGDPQAVELVCVTSANRIPFLTTGKVDLAIATMGYTQERAEVVSYSPPYLASGALLLVPKDSSVDEYSDLKGKTAITISGTTGSLWLTKCMPDVRQIKLEQNSSGLIALEQGRGATFVQDGSVLFTLAAGKPKLEVRGNAEAVSYWGIGIRKDDDDIQAWVEAAYERMRQEDFFWKAFQEATGGEQQQFEKYVPRPKNEVTYPEGSVYQCN